MPKLWELMEQGASISEPTTEVFHHTRDGVQYACALGCVHLATNRDDPVVSYTDIQERTGLNLSEELGLDDPVRVDAEERFTLTYEHTYLSGEPVVSLHTIITSINDSYSRSEAIQFVKDHDL